MAEQQLASVLHHLRHLTSTAPGGELTDAQLLGRFTKAGEEAAFTALLERHGRLVWSVCRHVLRHEQDAEDAFQATFLVLSRKAASIRKSESLASWLHGVAYRVALKARTRAQQRDRRDRSFQQALAQHELASSVPTEAALREVQAILDDEVRLLPEKLRAPFVLCCLEGRSKTEAARELGWKEGTVSGRLAQARERLRSRLARRGVALSAALTATALAEGAASAAVPASVHAAVAGAVSGKVAASAGAAALAEGVMQSMFVNKLRGVMFLLLLASLGFGWIAHAMRGAAPPDKPAEPGAPREGKQAIRPAEEKPLPVRIDRLGDPLPPGALARLGTVRLRHGNAVSAVVYGRDGTFVASASNDGTVRLWEVATGKERACLRGHHTASVYSLALSPDGKTLASGGGDSLVCLWDVATAGRPGTKPRQLSGHKGSIATLAFSRDGKLLFTGDNEGICVWDVANGTLRQRFAKGMGWAYRLALSQDGKTLVSVHLTGDFPNRRAAIHLWNVPACTHIREMTTQKMIYHIALSPDGETLASGGDDGPKVWEVASGSQLVKLRGVSSYTPSVIFSPNGRTLLAGGAGFFREWRLPTGREIRSFPVGSDYTYNAAFSPDGKTLATGGTRSVTLWDTKTAKPRHSFVGHNGEVGALLFTPDSKELLTGGYGRPIYRWEATTGREVGRLLGPLPGWNSTLSLSPDGKILAALGKDLAIHLLDAKTGKEQVKFTKHLPPRTSAGTQQYIVFAPDGKTVFSATLGVDQSIRKWEVETGNEVLTMPLGAGNGAGLAISPDGKTLYSVTLQGPVRVWDAATGKELRQIGKPGWGMKEMLVSPDGRRLAGVLVDRVCVWDAATGREVCGLPRPQRGWAHRLAFSADSRTLAVVGTDEDRVYFHELATGRLRLELTGLGAAVKAISFSPDGRLFATGSADTTALVWDYRALPLLGEPASELSGKKLEALVTALSSDDAKAAFRAVCALARAPKQAIPLLAERLGKADAKKIEALIGQLDAKEFEVRDKAMKALAAMGMAAAPALRKAQKTSADVDVRLRAGVVLRQLEKVALTQRLLGLRALEVLEMAGTAEARRVIEDLARGPAEAELTQEAKAALGRMRALRKEAKRGELTD
jgi:RNA polymerase sigma factor (sigma-70 family)